MLSCPICGDTDFMVGKSCKKYGQTVCIDCCKQCRYYIFDDLYIMHRCKYGVAEAEKVRDEIGDIKRKIAKLDKEQADLYRKGNKRKADDVIWEIVELEMKLKRLGA